MIVFPYYLVYMSSFNLKDWSKDAMFEVDIEVEVQKPESNNTSKPMKTKPKKKGLHEKTVISRSINMEIVVSSGPKNPLPMIEDVEDKDEDVIDLITAEKREPVIRFEDDTDKEAIVTTEEDGVSGIDNENFRL